MLKYPALLRSASDRAWLVQRSGHRRGQGLRVADRNQSTEPSVFQNLARSESAIGADHRTPTGHGFDQNGGKRLVSRGQDEQIGPCQERIRIFHKAGKVDVFGDTKLVRQRDKFAPETSFAEHDQSCGLTDYQTRKRSKQIPKVLSLNQLSDRDDYT